MTRKLTGAKATVAAVIPVLLVARRTASLIHDVLGRHELRTNEAWISPAGITLSVERDR